MPSKASDFKKRRQSKQQVVELTLPSGLSISAKRPEPAWFLFHASLPRQVINPESTAPGFQSVEDVQKLTEWIRALLEEVVVAPKIRLNPAEDEISPSDIDDADLQYIVNWSMGEVKEADGKPASLATFPEQSAPAGVGNNG